MKLGEVTHYNLKSEQILAEGWQDLNEAQRIYVGKWERDVWPLVEGLNKLLEADLDPKQIDKIFSDAEQVAIDSGNNKTALGKAGQVVGDQAKKLTDQIGIESIEIEDKSFLHKNHAGNQEGRYHLKIILSSNELKVLSRIESNKRIYKILDKELKEYIHSIQILIS